MSEEKLREGLGGFNEAFGKRINALSSEEEQQFIEGVVFALDALVRFGELDVTEGVQGLTLMEFFEFLGTLKSNAYSTAVSKKDLDSETHMQPLIESDTPYHAKAFVNAGFINILVGKKLSISEKIRIQNYVTLSGIDPSKLPKEFGF